MHHNHKDRVQQEDRYQDRVKIVEVSPRDGLQNIPSFIPTATKIELIRRLAATGLSTIEIASVVSPRAVPQLRDWRRILGDASIKRLLEISGDGDGDGDGDDPGMESSSASTPSSSLSSSSPTITTTNSRPSDSDLDSENEDESENKSKRKLNLPILLPNLKGLTLALSHTPKIDNISLFLAATEPFSNSNTNCTVAEGLSRAISVAHAASNQGVKHIRAYVSCVFRDPITTEPTPHSTVLQCTRHLLDSGIDEIALSDTDGSGTPVLTVSLLSHLLSHDIPVEKLACHFHDTQGLAVQNVWAAYELGVRVFDGSVAGLGGCPFAPGARGNVDTLSLVRLFEGRRIRTGIDEGRLAEVGGWVKGVLEEYQNKDEDVVRERKGETTGELEEKSAANAGEENKQGSSGRSRTIATVTSTSSSTTRAGEYCGWTFSRPLGIER
ncbi:hypothetical protein BDW74DRAFT_181455 [Aspergillus multicolor]|uniref:hydroxymethylglutaryl-CoA lyase n=1 Tax=Aspergillus multicolor TaxID=41759 RepID=UPI003CCD29B5